MYAICSNSSLAAEANPLISRSNMVRTMFLIGKDDKDVRWLLKRRVRVRVRVSRSRKKSGRRSKRWRKSRRRRRFG